MTLVLAALAGIGLGLALGALGAGGSLLTVPLLVYGFDQSPAQATTGSLVVVGVTAVSGGVTAYRAGNVRLIRGLGFAMVTVAGAAVGARAAAYVRDDVLLAAFAALMLVVAGVMAWRQFGSWRASRRSSNGQSHHQSRAGARLDHPIISLRDGFLCDCPRAVKLVVAGSLVGVLTGFLGVGGGFLVVPALTLALGLTLVEAAGTSLLVIALTSLTALVVRTGSGITLDWGVVAAVTLAAAAAAVIGVRLADRLDNAKLAAAFTSVLVLAAGYTAAQALPALF